MGRRVVVTGTGLLCGVGNTTKEVWSNLLAGRSGVGRITHFDPTQHSCQIAAEVKNFDPLNFVDKKEARKMGRFIHFAFAAAQEAMAQSGLEVTPEIGDRVGVFIGSGIGGLQGIAETALLIAEKGPRRVSPFFIPGRLINLVSGYASIRFGYKGPNHAVVTACASGAHAIGDAARLIMYDDADMMLCGGAEATVCRIGIAGFNACKALSTAYNDTPEKASRPYDKDRDGFVMGEGAGALMLEEYEHAKARGAKIYGEVKGYGLSGDAYHITAPAEDGDGGFRAMQMALKRSGLQASDID